MMLQGAIERFLFIHEKQRPSGGASERAPLGRVVGCKDPPPPAPPPSSINRMPDNEGISPHESPGGHLHFLCKFVLTRPRRLNESCRSRLDQQDRYRNLRCDAPNHGTAVWLEVARALTISFLRSAPIDRPKKTKRRSVSPPTLRVAQSAYYAAVSEEEKEAGCFECFDTETHALPR